MDAIEFQLLDIMAVAWLLIPLIPLSVGKGMFLDGINEEYFSKDACNNYRGIFVLAILFGHIAQRTSTGTVFHDSFINLGALSVTVFFFISGYGLQKSHINKDDYNKHFLAKRLPNVIFPYIIITFVRWVQYAINGTIYSPQDILIKIIEGNAIVPFSWFVLAITYFYFIYWLLMKTFKRHYFLMIIGAFIGYILYTAICIKMGYDFWWYISAPAFIFGMFWATYEKNITNICRNNTWLLWLVLVLSLSTTILLFYKYNVVTNWFDFTGKESLIIAFRNLLFALNFILFVMKFRIGNRITKFLGEISYELYITQGLIIESACFGITNDFAWCCYVTVATIIISYVFHLINAKILTGYKAWLNRHI